MKFESVMTPPSLKRATEVTPTKRSSFVNPVGKNAKNTHCRREESVVRVKGEFDYDHNISRQAYTSYLNINSLKQRIQIAVVNTADL